MGNKVQIFKNQQLITLKENDNGEILINGRELHQFLDVESKYQDWIKRMIEYGFTENIDYTSIVEPTQKKEGSRMVTRDLETHILKLDMAKEIAMIQRNEKGKQARQYFIAVEKAWNSPEMIMKRALEIANRNVQNLQLESAQQKQIINELQPKATYYDLVLQNPTLISISIIAKDYGMSGTKLNELLHDLGIQYKMGTKKKYTWLLYSKYQDKGYTFSKTQPYVDSKGVSQSKLHTYWTQKGRLFIYDLLKQQGILPIIEREVACN
ncbi:phage antirepressor Ant [Clostridium tetani]|uniref:phage antirepressor KilAC domain-containing protein n=1 Tax=Clostridium tetani TaxID=1513 RepID=UPI00100BFB4E|nr:phage antirepressor KilAC domain-containing protein [Clostridium tetani]RXM79612.1 phage antirepressor Ant [Clostridium tetani]RYV00426.1 phage antirepressor Ant [Clostridium tetani]